MLRWAPHWSLALIRPCVPAAAQVLAAGPATEVKRDAEVPQKARDVLAEIQKRDGEPLPGYVGGRTFGNRERRLPRGQYREYDVHPRHAGRIAGPSVS